MNTKRRKGRLAAIVLCILMMVMCLAGCGNAVDGSAGSSLSAEDSSLTEMSTETAAEEEVTSSDEMFTDRDKDPS